MKNRDEFLAEVERVAIKEVEEWGKGKVVIFVDRGRMFDYEIIKYRKKLDKERGEE